VLGIAALMLGCKPNATGIGEVAGDHRELTAEEKKVVGTYEGKEGANTYRYVFLDNGKMECPHCGKKEEEELKWSIVLNKIHIVWANNNVIVWKLNPDNSITLIADIIDGKREDYSKEVQFTYKKIN
jgi:hypothetical protein